ncbi:hypothetical protein M1247_04355 [Mycobacterium sp. 21AC1]|uniref:hypothetical protein n=1 Tax=[Mycobacterium] appelbergii TaxID=2939269 RepID=UPI002938EE7F|nr:hypothetical protein [Mycobacterium sp. 21AC1]MDV3124134.1 hypothetical protein [Mycobacterium sp. 21AC1]
MPAAGYPTDPGDELVFENDRIRVWAMNLGPGEAIFYHSHQHDHLILWPTAGRARSQDIDDEEDWQHVQNAEKNFAFFKTVGHTTGLTPHRLKNLEDYPVTHYIIELISERSPSAVELPAETNGKGELSREHIVREPRSSHPHT